MNQDKDQSHGSRSYSRAFGLGIGLNLAYVIAEAGFGIAVNSAALLADAGHNFGDVLGLAEGFVPSLNGCCTKGCGP